MKEEITVKFIIEGDTQFDAIFMIRDFLCLNSVSTSVEHKGFRVTPVFVDKLSTNTNDRIVDILERELASSKELFQTLLKALPANIAAAVKEFAPDTDAQRSFVRNAVAEYAPGVVSSIMENIVRQAAGRQQQQPGKSGMTPPGMVPPGSSRSDPKKG